MLEKFLKKEKSVSGAHYSGKTEKKEGETRYDALKRYTRKAKMDYQRYIDQGAPEDIEEIKKHFNDEQIQRIREYNWLDNFKTKENLVSNFRMKVRKAARLKKLIAKIKEREDFGKEKLAKLTGLYLVAKKDVNDMVEGAGKVLEFSHRFVVREEKRYYHKFKPLLKLEKHLKSILKRPVGPTSDVNKIFNDKIKNLINLDKIKRLVSNNEESKKITEKREDVKKDSLFWSNVRDAVRDVSSDLYEKSSQLSEDDEFKEFIKNSSLNIGDEELVEEMQNFLFKKIDQTQSRQGKDFISKEHLKDTLHEISSDLDKIWEEDALVRRCSYRDLLNNMIAQDQTGDRVLETPRVIKLMNQISESESIHKETPVAAVLVGPPGTGKSLGIEHYLATNPDHNTKPSPVIIDMSQETSEYVLLGGEKVDLSDKASTVKHLSSLTKEREKVKINIENEDDEKTKNILQQKLDKINHHLEDIIHFSIGADLEKMKKRVDLQKSGQDKKGEDNKESNEKQDKIQNQVDSSVNEIKKQAQKQGVDKEDISEVIEQAMHKWEAEELSNIMFGNGWRYGAMSKAVKEGRDIIINEFNNFKSPPDAIRQLLQTPIGDEWHFTAENKSYTMNSYIYMTANIDEQYDYDTAELSSPISSRLPRAIEIEYPDPDEELMIAQAKLSDNFGAFLLNKNTTSELLCTTPNENLNVNLEIGQAEKIVYLITKIVPRLRHLADEYPQEIPAVSLRNLDFFCRHLVDRETRELTEKSVEDAFVNFYLSRFTEREESWKHLLDSGIIEDMYKDGLLHSQDPNSASYKFIRKAVADLNDINIEGAMSKAAKQEQMVKIEDYLQGYDKDLIEELKKDPDWKRAIEKAKEHRKQTVDFFSPEIAQEKLSFTFEKDSERPEAR